MKGMRLAFLAAGLAVAAIAFAALFCSRWTARGPMASSGGLWFPRQVVLPVPGFAQNDPRWGGDFLGPTPGRLGNEGCAVTSAAMVLSYYGVETDPHFLNLFLTETGGYTPQGWIEWEGAAVLKPGLRKEYEDAPSAFLIDRNLWRGIPSIVRLRMRNGITHFVVIVGKRGLDYLIRDPGAGFRKDVYPLRELTPRIEALRFYAEVPAK